MKKSLELQKAKAELVKKQVEQQKLLLVQLEKCTNPAQKKEIIKVRTLFYFSRKYVQFFCFRLSNCWRRRLGPRTKI